MTGAKELPRRTISELATKYTFHPELRDVYVEGVTDRDFLSWLFGSLELRGISVFPVESVDVPEELVKAYFPAGGNKARVLALGTELQKEQVANRCAFVIDRDVDSFLWTPILPEGGLFTDYGSLELYCYSKESLKKFLRVTCGISVSADDAIATLEPVLRSIFALRLSKLKTCLAGRWAVDRGLVPVENACKLDGTSIQLDLADFATRVLTKNHWPLKLDEFMADIEQIRLSLAGEEVRRVVHGKDFAELLHWYVRKVGGRHPPDKRTIIRNLLTCLEVHQIRDCKLLCGLKGRLGAPTG